MSQENVELVARLVDARNQANVEAMLALFDPEFEVTFPPEDRNRAFPGHTELREWAEGFLAASKTQIREVAEFIDADHSIVVILHPSGEAGSGIEWTRPMPTTIRFSDGKVTVGASSATGAKPSKPPACRSSRCSHY